MKAINLTEYDYIVESERDSDSPTVFRLRPLDGLERLALGVLARRVGEDILAKSVLNKGLVGWRSLKSESGNDISFHEDIEDNLKLLPVEVMSELVESVMEASALSEDQEKN